MRQSILKFFYVIFLTITFSHNIWAHAILKNSSPANHEVLISAPQDIQLVFNQPVQLLNTKLTNEAGDEITLQIKDASRTGDTLQIVLPNLSRNNYQFHWAVISEDGHPVNGTLEFEVTR